MKKIPFLQIVTFSAVWISCHAPAEVDAEVPKWERLQEATPALIEQVNRDYTIDVVSDSPIDVGQMRVSEILFI